MKALLKKLARLVTVERALLLVIVILQAAILKNLWDQRDSRTAEDSCAAVVRQPDLERQADFGAGSPARLADSGPSRLIAGPSPAVMMGEMEAFLDTVLGDFEAIDRFMNPPRGWGAFEPTPALDMHESRDGYTVVFAVPHLDAASMRVSLHGRMLSVTGLPAGAHRHAAPRVFESRVLLPGPVGGAEGAEAMLTNGLLRVSIPKALPSRQVADAEPAVLRLR